MFLLTLSFPFSITGGNLRFYLICLFHLSIDVTTVFFFISYFGILSGRTASGCGAVHVMLLEHLWFNPRCLRLWPAILLYMDVTGIASHTSLTLPHYCRRVLRVCVSSKYPPVTPSPSSPCHTNGNSTSLYVNTYIVTARVPYSPLLPSRGPKYETIYSPTDTRNAEPKTGEKGPWTFRGAATDP